MRQELLGAGKRLAPKLGAPRAKNFAAGFFGGGGQDAIFWDVTPKREFIVLEDFSKMSPGPKNL